MSDFFSNGIQIPSVASNTPVENAENTALRRIFFRGERLVSKNAQGIETFLTPENPAVRVAYIDTVSTANGNWSINYANLNFTQVLSVIPTVIFDTANLTDQKLISINQITLTSARGRVMDSNTIAFLGAGDGLQFAGPGFQVRVRVEGI